MQVENTTQIERLMEVLKDKKVHEVPEILRRVYGVRGPSSARLGSRIHDLRSKWGLDIETQHVEGTVWSYQLIRKTSPSRKAGGKKAK
jgi:hypothetical protein